MSKDRTPQFQTETPFLPTPLATEVLEALAQPFATLSAGEALQARLASILAQLAAAIDTVDMAISQNHAAYLGKRRSWSYETKIEVDNRLRILKRQRQHVQDSYGRCNRRLKHLEHARDTAPKATQLAEAARALAFVRAATVLLDATTLALIWDAVETP